MKKDLKEHSQKASDFFIGQDIVKVRQELNQVVDEVYENKFLQRLQAKSIVMKQWEIVIQHPKVSCKFLETSFVQASLLPNSEAGCEQSNSKYARVKDKYSSVMKTPMIRARMRVGSMDHHFIYLMQQRLYNIGKLMVID